MPKTIDEKAISYRRQNNRTRFGRMVRATGNA
jgi:hypothetical protein